MNLMSIRNLLIGSMVCLCASIGMAKEDVGVGKPSVESFSWLVNADAQSADVGIERYIVRSGRGKNGTNILVMGDLSRMAIANLNRADDVSSIRLTMLASGEQLDIFRSRHSIQVGLNSMTVLEVNMRDGEILGSMEAIRDSEAGDVMYALLHDQNLEAHFARSTSEPSIGYGCDQACRIEYPRPDDCLGPFDELACCDAEVHYDFCRRVCQCGIDFDEWWQFPARKSCEDIAKAMFLYEGLKCGADFLWPLS